MRLRLTKIDATIIESGYWVHDGNRYLGAIEQSEALALTEHIEIQEQSADVASSERKF